jgi:hypothetical protein
MVVYCTDQCYSGRQEKECVTLGADEAGASRGSIDIDEEGFDISLIRETLQMSPDERLVWHQGLVRVIEELRHAIKR